MSSDPDHELDRLRSHRADLAAYERGDFRSRDALGRDSTPATIAGLKRQIAAIEAIWPNSRLLVARALCATDNDWFAQVCRAELDYRGLLDEDAVSFQVASRR